MQNVEQGSAVPRRSLRLTFEYEGRQIRMSGVQSLEKQARPSDPLRGRADERPRSGFWIELQSADGRAIYRQVMAHPIRFHAEVPDGKGGFTNRPIGNPRGRFFAVVPDLADAEQVVIYSSPLGPEAEPGPAEPVARFPLRPKGGAGAQEVWP